MHARYLTDYMVIKDYNRERRIYRMPPPFLSTVISNNPEDFSPTTYEVAKCITSGLSISKVIFIGDVAVGKSSLINRFSHHIFETNYKATIGVDFEIERFEIMNVNFNLQIWDTAGQERFKCIAKSYYRGANAIILVFSLCDQSTLVNVKTWLQEALKMNNTTPLVFLVGTKRDKITNLLYIDIEKEAVKIAKQCNAEYWSVSSRTGYCVDDFFNRLAALTFDIVIQNDFIQKAKPLQINDPITLGSIGKQESSTSFCNGVKKRNMESVEQEQVVDSEQAESILSMFGILDWVLIAGLVIGAWYFLFKKSEKKEEFNTTKYSIQPAGLTMGTTDNSFIKKLKSSGRSLVVFYGSQTGTGEEFAGRLAKEGVRYKMKGMVADPEECDMEELTQLKDIPNSLAVFCLATYGEGDPTDNAMEFYEWIKNGDADLTGLNYAVFGLGNKTYEHYNEVGIYVDKRLEELGAHRVYQLGLGDDDANIEDDFITWKDKFWPAVCEYFGIESTGEEEMIRQYRLVENLEVAPDRIYSGEIARLHSYRNQRPPYDSKNPYLAPMKVNKELHKGGDRSCLHIEFDIEGSKMRYDAGDHLAMFPVNNTELVNRIGELCGMDLDQVFSLINTDTDSSKKHPFPCPTSYRTALTHYLEITAIPRTHVLKELAEYCSDEADKEKLRLMSSTSPEGKALFSSWVTGACRNIVHILEDIPSCKPPLDHLCELLPRLQPRYYSISSSPKLHPNSVHITAVVVKYETPSGRVNKGVATTWLADMHPINGKELPVVPIYIRKSQFRLPVRSQIPIIMIGPGTGLAPFRGFIQERDLARKEDKPLGDTILYFGCRHKGQDYLYEEELETYAESGLIKLHLAFSRDQAKKVYVTHLLEQNADELWDVIGNNNGHVYICGDARSMALDVRDIVLKVIREKGNMNESEATQYLKKMESQKRYSADVWS